MFPIFLPLPNSIIIIILFFTTSNSLWYFALFQQCSSSSSSSPLPLRRGRHLLTVSQENCYWQILRVDGLREYYSNNFILLIFFQSFYWYDCPCFLFCNSFLLISILSFICLYLVSFFSHIYDHFCWGTRNFIWTFLVTFTQEHVCLWMNGTNSSLFVKATI